MVKLLLFIFFPFFIACSSQSTKDESVLIDTLSLQKEVSPINNFSSQFFLIDSLHPKMGYGYNILLDNKIFVHQPTIPSIAGNISFSSKEKAESVANLVILKLKNNIMPPSISTYELDSLNILK